MTTTIAMPTVEITRYKAFSDRFDRPWLLRAVVDVNLVELGMAINSVQLMQHRGGGAWRASPPPVRLNDSGKRPTTWSMDAALERSLLAAILPVYEAHREAD